MDHLGADITEICLATATPVTRSARIVPFTPRAAAVVPVLRPLLRHADLISLVRAWRRVALLVDGTGADVVLAHPCQYLQAPPVLALASPPSVYFCHEPRRIDYEPGLQSTRSSLTRIPYAPLHAAERAIDRRGVAAAGRLVTNSRFTAGRIRSAYGRASTPIPLGVDEFFAPAPSSTAGHLLSVGTLIPGKGHDVVIRAAAVARTRRHVVVVAPRPDPAEHARLAAIARDVGVGLDVRVGISDGELRDLYRGAFATVQMAAAEPLGLASMEAQACGSPVVVAAEGGLPETIEEGRTGWAVPRDRIAVGAKIDALSDHNIRARMTTAAAQRGAMLRWAQSGAALQAVLREAVAAE
jgi:glycosyltransferase involved in cell wall biosynthesis